MKFCFYGLIIRTSLGNGVPVVIATPPKKLFKVVYVFGCPAKLNDVLLSHMERFGDLFDFDDQGEAIVYTYKDPSSAQLVFIFTHNCFIMELMHLLLGLC
jgi:hypothetical protein